MGKTYVAIAVAQRYPRLLVVAPAALMSMWQSALERAQTEAEIRTFEALSRADADAYSGKPQSQCRFDIVVVDEAHHARNPRTNRYFALESLVRGAKVLLVSATPIHNRRADLVALLSLFLGSRARTMTSSELAQCVVRREQHQLESRLHIPEVRPTISHEVGDDNALVQALMNLPPPVPVRDGGVAAGLIGRSLVHQWASSEAALREAVRRRIARATALCVSLESGTYPTMAELESWIYDNGALQLGFAQLLSAPIAVHAELHDGVRDHLAALKEILSGLGAATHIDAERASIVQSIRSARKGARIVAFAQYAGTVSMLYRRLSPTGYVAMLTSHGARVAGGSLTRRDAIARFAPVATRSKRPPPSEAIELLLTTDLLSEGVNLHDADTVIHLDIPWTAARMEQRVGRVARLGSSHHDIHVHLIRPPVSAATVLASEAIIERKSTIASEEESTPRKVERLRGILKSWGQPPHLQSAIENAQPLVGAVVTTTEGFIAAVSIGEATTLLVGRDGQTSADLDTQLEVCAEPQIEETIVEQSAVDDALERVQRWFATQRAASFAGVSSSSALQRRELIARIDRSIESAPPQLRSARLELAERARRVVIATQCAAVEQELDDLSRASLSEEDWLAAIADIDAQQASLNPSDDEYLRIHAILLLVIKPRRSRSPSGRESP